MNTSSILLERLGALIQQSVREDAARHGLLPIHVQVLRYLAMCNRYSDLPVAIADYFGITRGTVSQTLSVLERKGLVIKEADERHGRRLHLRLTPAGTAASAGGWPERLETALQSLPDAASGLDETLRALLLGLQRLNGQHAFGTCRHCAHFLVEPEGARCGLTREPLAEDQTSKLCREWSAPDARAGAELENR